MGRRKSLSPAEGTSDAGAILPTISNKRKADNDRDSVGPGVKVVKLAQGDEAPRRRSERGKTHVTDYKKVSEGKETVARPARVPKTLPAVNPDTTVDPPPESSNAAKANPSAVHIATLESTSADGAEASSSKSKATTTIPTVTTKSRAKLKKATPKGGKKSGSKRR